MPFTPLHLGPGFAIKALAGRHFSLLTFGVAQVAMDIEPLIGLMNGADRLHGITHTYLAALMIAVAVAVIAPTLCRPLLRRWNRELVFYRWEGLVTPAVSTPVAVIAGAFVGTLSHVLLDRLMHADLTPFTPWSDANGLLGLMSIPAVHQGCLMAGLFGLAVWLMVAWRQRRAIQAGLEPPP
ncbi:DUF4184 family protein [uncultured Thiocystis sp.]|jgi:hypothetical protein|uniref:DUF4184 family protein n=1 Tax=uncultured Thiocystis sp. TaxID=1202134 RepID=UPI0025F84171|nr:DUF4184 family protein [uncultured Thiocystis sp.]